MKKVLSVVAVLMLAACTTVPAGYVGVKVNNYGTQRGVQGAPLVTGRVFFNPWTEDVYKFPTFLQNEVWTKDQHEGAEHDESITFTSIEGANINADIGVSVAFEPSKVPAIFVEQRKEPQQIIDVYIRNQVRDSFTRHAGRMKVVDIYGAGKQALIDSVKSDLREHLTPRGYVFDNVSIIGMRVDPTVQNSINAVLQAAQRAIEAENKVKQSTAEAEQKVATARGDSASAVIEATGKAEANAKLLQSLTPALIAYQTVQKWDGVLPTVQGGTPLITLPNTKQ